MKHMSFQQDPALGFESFVLEENRLIVSVDLMGKKSEQAMGKFR